MLVTSVFVIMMWSIIGISKTLLHINNSRVSNISASEGSASPEGWLWSKMMEAAA